MESKRKSFSPIEITQMTGVDLNVIYRWVWKGKLKAEKKNGRWQIPAEEVEKLLKRRKNQDEQK